MAARVVLLLVGLVLAVPTPSLAQGRLHPTFFALSPVNFPLGSRVVRAGVESNLRLLRDDWNHFGFPPAVMGRLTGYYMGAVEGDLVTESHPYTSYLVSIFQSSRQAQTAFDLRWNVWFVADYYTTPSPAPVALGDAGAEAYFHTLDPRQPQLFELFFRRGAILVEVFQGTSGAAPTAMQIHSFMTIAEKLDRVAGRHPAGL
jgi:hypothetical protein